MEAHPRRLRALFRADVRLVVPLFQRPYVWNADDQWMPLWEDVVATRDRVARGDDSPHFLGAVVLVQRPHAHGSLEVREVIDGQQRLTTLQLLICALRDAYTVAGLAGRSHRQLVKMLENDPEIIASEVERFRLWPTNRDRSGFRSVVAGDHRDALASSHADRIVAGYLWFREAIAALIESEGEAEEVLDALTGVLLDGLEVVVIDLDDKDNAQVIFETLNARGTPLRASDLIKNLVFRVLDDGSASVEELYARFWQPLEAPGWERDVRVGRLLRSRLDTFMGYFLVITLSREVQAHQIFPAARSWIGSDRARARDFLRELARYAEVYDGVDQQATGDPATDEILQRLTIVDTQTTAPVVLWVVANSHGEDRLAALRAIESYVVRRSLCRLTTKNYNRTFLELLRRLDAGETPVGHVVTEFLARQTSDSGVWPSDAELRRSLAVLPVYRLLKRGSLQAVLRVLERQATTNRSEMIDSSAKLSIEHLLPQQWQETWTLPSGGEADEIAASRDALLHTIGNLTLITPWLNSGLSNRPWELKRPDILASSALSLNRSLPPSWDEAAIQARSDWMAYLAVQAWPRPLMGDTEALADESERDLRPDRDESAPRSSGRSPGSKAGQRAHRRDVGLHIANAFKNIPSGTFLTIQQIKNTPSPEYGDDSPSAGAVSARLFPSTGKPTTVAGIEPTRHNGVRGARKI